MFSCSRRSASRANRAAAHERASEIWMRRSRVSWPDVSALSPLWRVCLNVCTRASDLIRTQNSRNTRVCGLLRACSSLASCHCLVASRFARSARALTDIENLQVRSIAANPASRCSASRRRASPYCCCAPSGNLPRPYRGATNLSRSRLTGHDSPTALAAKAPSAGHVVITMTAACHSSTVREPHFPTRVAWNPAHSRTSCFVRSSSRLPHSRLTPGPAGAVFRLRGAAVPLRACTAAAGRSTGQAPNAGPAQQDRADPRPAHSPAGKGRVDTSPYKCDPVTGIAKLLAPPS